MPIHFGEGSRMRIIYTTARFEVMSHRSIGQSTLHMLWRRLLRHPESHRSISQLTLKRLFYVKTFQNTQGQVDFGVALRGPVARGRIDWPILRWILALKMFYVKNFTSNIFHAQIHRTIRQSTVPRLSRAVPLPSWRRPSARYRYVC